MIAGQGYSYTCMMVWHILSRGLSASSAPLWRVSEYRVKTCSAVVQLLGILMSRLSFVRSIG